MSLTNEYITGTTVVLQAVYSSSVGPIDADATPPVSVEIRNSKGHVVQTNLIPTREGVGTYRIRYQTNGLRDGTYFFVFTAYFGSLPDRKSSSFVLKSVA